jgi:hypothetical protein
MAALPETRRRPYAPMPHPGRRGRWDEDAIIAALRRWTAETGSPPRSEAWSGTRRDHAGPAQRKWMREHPRWPSGSCVRAHFGSWSAALEAAGLPARRLTFDDPVAERVGAAQRLAAAGHTVAEVAAHLGVSTSTAGNYLRAGRCPDCGGPVVKPGAERCAGCTRHEPTVARAWTRAEVLAAVRAWRAERGRPPSYRDWTPSRSRPGRWEAESPRWPSAAVVCRLFAGHDDPWNAALTQAGQPVRFERWSDARIRSSLAAFWALTGRLPSAADVDGPFWTGPSTRTLRRRFGGVEQAGRALAPVPADVIGAEAPEVPLEVALVGALSGLMRP